MARKLKLYIGAATVSIVLILYGALLVFLFGLAPAVRFVEEEIIVSVYPGRITVAGTFVFKNPAPLPIAQGLFFPVPVDAAHAAPSFFTVTKLASKNVDISSYGRPEKRRFDLFFGPEEKMKVLIRYGQPVAGMNATYILTTTEPWGRPLQYGVYRLKPFGVRITDSNYPVSPDDEGGLSFERRDFMPKQDWTFSWEVQ